MTILIDLEMSIVRRGRVKFVVEGFADKVNTEGGNTETKARNSMAELIGEHGVLPPCIPPSEELSS